MNERVDPNHAMVHDLKIDPLYLSDIRNHRKKFEVRRDDRDYKKGDYLLLHGYSQNDQKYIDTGWSVLESIMVRVTQVFGRAEHEKQYVKPGYVIMSIEVID